MTDENIYSDDFVKFMECVKKIEGPGVIYNINYLTMIVEKIINIISKTENIYLNFAIKACYNNYILTYLSHLGLGCDVSSVGELALAKKNEFIKITSTSPYYSLEDMEIFANNKVVLDVNSINQFKLFTKNFPNNQVGLRIRIPIPSEFDNKCIFGLDSRFGIDIYDEKSFEIIDGYKANVVSIHAHNGLLNAETFFYKLRYMLTIAKTLPNITKINLGGGFTKLFDNTVSFIKLINKADEIIEEWKNQNKREIEVIIEPGSAIIEHCGFLLTNIVDVEFHKYYKRRFVLVDTSAWNLVPWGCPEMINISDLNKDYYKSVETVVCGTTCYEYDIFNMDNNFYKEIKLGKVKLGDKIIMSNFGAYTTTNLRKFNMIEKVREYKYYDGEILLIE